MNIVFEEQELQELQDIFNQLDMEEVIFMNHYQLAKETGITSDRWKRFLTHPQVSKWLQQELQLFKEHQLKQMIRDATDDKRSVGAAQMMNSLTKALQENKIKEGPHIIYTYVPLTEEQKLGTSVEHMELRSDVIAAIPTEWEEDE